MKIAISADTNEGLNSRVAAHFGRCPFFALIDLDESKVVDSQVIDNPFFANHSPGQVPEFVQKQGANVMLSGGMGRRAVMIFEQFGIQTATGAQGTVDQAVKAYLQGKLSGASPCSTSEAHHTSD